MILFETHFINQKLQLCLVYTIDIFVLDFGRTKLSPKMKDFIAKKMSQHMWIDICRKYLNNESPNKIKEDIPYDIYEQAYYVISLLINTGKVSCWSDMENVLNECDKSIVKAFTLKFKEAPLQGQLNKPLF